MSDINLIITCSHTECKYCNEGECGKPVLMVDDKECIVISHRKE